MLLKIAGSAAVLLACAGFGFFAASEVERREQQLRSLYASFLLIQGDIRYRKSSLPEAFLMAGRKQGDFAAFFDAVARRLYRYEDGSFEQVFCEELRKCAKESALKKKDIALLEQLSGMCGQMDGELTMVAFDWYLEQAGEEIDVLARENVQKTALLKRMGILAGIFLLVLLL